MNEAQIIVTGNIANKPSLGTTPAGVSVANMRVGYTPRRLDRESGQWVDGQTSWISVKCWRKLADHVAMCLEKGDPVLVKGALQVRPYTDKEGNARLGVEVLASAIGHDLNRGVAQFFRIGRKSGAVLAGTQGEPAGVGGGQPGAEAPDGAANGQPGPLRSISEEWDPARDGSGEDPDAEMFDEAAVVAAALHAVPDLEEVGDADGDLSDPVSAASGPEAKGGASEDRGLVREGAHPASGAPASPREGSPAPDAEAPGGPVLTDRKAPIPAQRKSGTRRSGGGRDGSAGSSGTGGRSADHTEDGASAPVKEPSLS